MDKYEFSKIIKELIVLLSKQGCATEGDFEQIYSVQYNDALVLLNDILHENGYVGDVISIGYTYSGIAVYGIYDPKIIGYLDAKSYLDIEGKKQESEL